MNERFEYIQFTFKNIENEWNSIVNDLSKEEFLDLINQIYSFNLQLENIEKNLTEIERKFRQSNFPTEFQLNKLNQNLEQLQQQFEQMKLDFTKSNSLSNISNNDENAEETIVYLDPNAPTQVHHQVKFSNNIVRYLKGPFKALVHGIMNAADVAAQHTEIDQLYLQVIQEKIDKEKDHSVDPSIRPTFTEITSDWKVEGENEDQGYSSPSIWIRDPQQRRILIKIQPLPLCVANEWLAYVLGKHLDLPVNEVQISIYKNDLVTLHTDDQNENEQTMTFMDLKEDKAELLLKQPILEFMDIFDHIIQNVDRNQQNILIIAPKTVDINGDDGNLDKIQLKIRLIDHASSFGMGKLSGISSIAAKFHSNHLSVVKFDPIEKSKQFESYLVNLPEHDRPVISRILTQLAAIDDEKFQIWLDEIKDLLTLNQYNRIFDVLKRQRHIAKRFLEQWNCN